MARILASGVFLSLICLSVCAPDGLKKNPLDDPLSDEFIDYINSLNTSWVAGRNFAKDTPLSHLKNLCGVRPGGPRLPVKVHDWENEDIPTEFDSRTKWSNCPTIKEIRDQGHCGSCWAFAAVTAISDRICIHSNAKTQSHISAENLVACAASGCFGGYVGSGWNYYQDHGLVSGGPYHSKQGCQPYTIETCKYKAPCMDFQPTPPCKKTCEAGYNKTFTEDLHFASKVYSLQGEKAFQVEIMKNGPIEVGFSVYEDFLHYKSGVYQRKSEKQLGGHAVRIIGWGVENKLPYWLIANSWNTVWGDHGYVKILRGSNECGIENEAAAGIPKPYSDY